MGERHQPCKCEFVVGTSIRTNYRTLCPEHGHDNPYPAATPAPPSDEP